MVPALQHDDMVVDATPFADETRAWLDAAFIDIGGNLAAMIQFALEALEFAGHRLSQTAVNPLLQSPGDPSGKEVGRKRRRGSPLHGHTPTEDVEFRPDLIGVDIGACYSGKLTALGLEGKARWVLQT